MKKMWHFRWGRNILWPLLPCQDPTVQYPRPRL